MNSSEQTLFDRLLAVTARFGRTGSYTKYAGEEPPLRSELFSADQMEQHGRNLALAHRLAAGHADRLLARLSENDGILVEVCDLLTSAVTASRRITPAAEWLLDNFYLVEEQIRTARRHLPKGYSRELPRLANGPSAGLPRVYDLAFETISHGDGRVDAEGLSRFVAAYQTVSPLALGELWAIPIMLRLALIENLRRVGARIAGGTIDRSRAAAWADQMLEVAEHDPKSLILVIADMARSNPPMVSAFVAELARLLQGHSAALALPLTWIEQRLAESGTTIEQLVHAEAQEQAGDQVSISNTIGSLRFLGSMDWREFVETMSVVERKLREDPGGLYGRMDFATRDRYRHVVEEIAKSSPLSESDVARKAIQLAHEGASGTAGKDGDDDRAAHVGFYLIDKGRPRLERAAEARPASAETLRRVARRVPLLLYLGAIAAITGSLTAALAAMAHAGGASDVALAALAVLLLLATSQLASGMVNWIATLLVTPRPLPRMDFSRGLPSQSRTLVVVPTMLATAASIESLVEALEVRYLANRDDNLHFGLLTDFQDASTETRPEDESLLQLARDGIESLNRKHRPAAEAAGNHGNGDTFFLFHRPRRWNPEERIWMGYERKRGKLADLNALLRGGAADAFSLVVGDTAPLSNVKYVITLDTDTQLPRDAARQFVGVMAHPLNRARFDGAGVQPGAEPVTEGYGILQPRVSVSLPGANRSWFARMHAGDPGIDPYTRAVSDVYQDVFGEGSFIGKGIYDVDAFEQALGGRFPENRILSHDLLEGCYARSGLLSDVQLYEEYPSTLWRGHQPPAPLDSRRLATGGLAAVARARTRQPAVDAIRCPRCRSGSCSTTCGEASSPAALTALLLLGWTVLPTAWLWTLVVIGILLLPPACAVVAGPVAQAGRGAAAPAPRHDGRRGRPAPRPCRGAHWPSCPTRRRSTSMRSHARRGECSSRIAGCSNGIRRRPTNPLAAAWRHGRALRTRGVRPVDVDRPGHRHGHDDPARRICARRARDCRADPVAVVPLAGNRLVDQPAARARRSAPDDGADDLPAQGRAQDLGVLRDLRRPGRPLAAAGQLPGTSGRQRRASHVADEHGPGVAGQPDRLRLRLRPGRTTRQAHGECARHDADDGTPPGALLQLVRHAVPAAAAAPLCLGGRQRQPRGSPDDAARRDCSRSPTTGSWSRSGSRGWATRCARSPTRSAGRSAVACSFGCRRISTPHTIPARRRSRRRSSGSTGSTRASPKWPRTSAPAPTPTAAGGAATAARRAILGARPRPPVRKLARRAGVPGAVERAGGRAERPRRPAGQRGAIPTLRELAALGDELLPAIERRRRTDAPPEEHAWLDDLRHGIAESSRRAAERMLEIERLASQCEALARMEYDFLYDSARHLLAIGYNVDERRRDPSYYDLLASEARLASFVAIAQGQLPQENWFALGRLLTTAGGQPVLLSWSGSMFEYLMPLLVMPTYDDTLLDQTCRATVARQIAYGKQRGVPWGISESGYNSVDASLNYQYRAFGVPGPGPQARARRGPRRRALRFGARADGGARGRVPQPAAARRRRARGAIRLLRGHRLHRRPRAARADERRRALVHGAPPGHDPARPGPPAARPSDAAALRVGPAVQGHAAAAAGAHSEGRCASTRTPRSCRQSTASPAARRRRCA